MSPKTERPGVFGHDPNDMVRHTFGDLSFDLQRNLDLGANDALQVGHDLFRDFSRGLAGPDRVNVHAPVEAFVCGIRRWWRRDLRGGYRTIVDLCSLSTTPRRGSNLLVELHSRDLRVDH